MLKRKLFNYKDRKQSLPLMKNEIALKNKLLPLNLKFKPVKIKSKD